MKNRLDLIAICHGYADAADFAIYLYDALVPAFLECGMNYTARDFRLCADIIEHAGRYGEILPSGTKQTEWTECQTISEFLHYLNINLIPAFREDGKTCTAHDFELCAKLIACALEN